MSSGSFRGIGHLSSSSGLLRASELQPRFGVARLALPKSWIEYAYPKRDDGAYSWYARAQCVDDPNERATKYACILKVMEPVAAPLAEPWDTASRYKVKTPLEFRVKAIWCQFPLLTSPPIIVASPLVVSSRTITMICPEALVTPL